MSSATPLSSHPILQNLSLIILSSLLIPLITTLALLSTFISRFLPISKHIRHYRRWRTLSSSTFRPRTILITNLHSPAALSLARTFYRAGHRVIGADHEPYYFPLPARFSKSIGGFYRLGSRERKLGRKRYIRDLLDIVRKEGVELWVNCSSDDADLKVKEVLEREKRCKVLQFGSQVIEVLGDEVTFRKEAKRFGLQAPDTHLITSEEEGLAVLYHKSWEPGQEKQYTIKGIWNGDTTSSDMTLLPLSTSNDIQAYIKTLDPTPTHPLVLQESITGMAFSAQALIINNNTSAFITYPTSSTQLTPLPASSLLSKAMLKYTTLLTINLSSSTKIPMTGHLSLAFLIPENLALPAASKCGVPDSEVHDLVSKIYAVECKPSISLGALAFADVSEDLASTYLSVLSNQEPKGIANGHRTDGLVTPKPGISGYYFLEYEVIGMVLLPVLQCLKGQVRLREMIKGWMEFLGCVLWWREVWWEVWDPWVAWWAYSGYVVGRGMIGLWEVRSWDVEDE
jgi:hypothetical protein